MTHTKSNGDISEASSGKAKEELDLLRKKANEIDDARESLTYGSLKWHSLMINDPFEAGKNLR